MSQIKKITAVRPGEGLNAATLAGSLAKNGYSRFPGTFFRLQPYPDVGGYRTGLDENANYIKKIGDPTEQEQEKAYVKSLREKAEALYGYVDLEPNSDFYRKMTDHKMNTEERCPFYKLGEGDNIFNLDKKEELIAYAFIRVHPYVAPSKEAMKLGDYSHARYYVNDEEVENAVAYKIKQRINEASGILGTLSTEKQKKIARQVGLPVTDNSTEAATYTMLDEYIKQSEKAKFKNQVELFLKMTELNDTHLGIRDLVTQAITYNVLRKKSDGKIYRGSMTFAETEKDAVVYLTDINNQEELISLEEDLKTKKSLK